MTDTTLELELTVTALELEADIAPADAVLELEYQNPVTEVLVFPQADTIVDVVVVELDMAVEETLLELDVQPIVLECVISQVSSGPSGNVPLSLPPMDGLAIMGGM